MSKRGGLVPRQLPRVKRVQVRQAVEEEEEAARHDSDKSVDSYPLELMNCPDGNTVGCVLCSNGPIKNIFLKL